MAEILRAKKSNRQLKPQTAAPSTQPQQGEQVVIRPMAAPANPKKRHWGLLLAFLVMVILPVAVSTFYLDQRAADQYASTVAFTVRSEDSKSAADLLGGLGQSFGGGAGNADSDILYEFIRSQALISKVDDRMNLRALYSTHIDQDPVFSFDPKGTIEDLTQYWQRMVRISFDTGSGLIEVRALAFEPDTAQKIAQAILLESTEMINNISAIAREDATRYAREDLDLAIERLKVARESLTAFRISSEIVDPTADVQGQVGLLNTLQTQLAEALIALDLLAGSTRDNDPRVDQAERRVEVIQKRIKEERRKFGVGNTTEGDEGYAKTIAEFERLNVDRQFAEEAYAAALQAFDAARAEANRKTRYLAAYIQPTKAQRSEFPNFPLLIGSVALFSFLIWAILSLVFYALRDRR